MICFISHSFVSAFQCFYSAIISVLLFPSLVSHSTTLLFLFCRFQFSLEFLSRCGYAHLSRFGSVRYTYICITTLAMTPRFVLLNFFSTIHGYHAISDFSYDDYTKIFMRIEELFSHIRMLPIQLWSQCLAKRKNNSNANN